jgi:hypothetical protein
VSRHTEQDLDERLRDLWGRRAKLSEPEWGELYGIIVRVLWNKCSDLVAQLPNARKDYLLDFFEDKVLVLGSPIHHAGVLVVYYRRYLLSRLREPDVKKVDRHQAQDTDDDAGSTRLELALEGQALTAHTDDAPASVQQLVDWVTEEFGELIPGSAAGSDPSQAQTLIRQFLGLDLRQAVQCAHDFLAGRGDWTELAGDVWWIRLYLCCHFCPEAPDRMPLHTLARTHRIPSHHYKAIALGITVPRQLDAALAAFRDSLRGRWLVRLGVPVDIEHRLEMSLALKVLCLTALSLQEPCSERHPSSATPVRP